MFPANLCISSIHLVKEVPRAPLGILRLDVKYLIPLKHYRANETTRHIIIIGDDFSAVDCVQYSLPVPFTLLPLPRFVRVNRG